MFEVQTCGSGPVVGRTLLRHWLVMLCCGLVPLMAVAEEDGIAQALQATAHQNPLARAKIEFVQSLGYRVDEARTGQLPTLSLIGQSNASNYNHGLFRVQQPLWAFGRIDGAIELASKQLISGQASLLLTRRQLMEDTAATYVTLYGGRQRLLIAEQNVAEHEKLLALIERRMVGGIASEADSLLARSRLAQAQAIREQIVGQVAKAKNDLGALTLRSIPAEQAIAADFVNLPPAVEVQALAQDNEAGVLQKMADLAVTEGAARQKSLELMPTISFRHERDISPNLPMGSTLSANRSGIYMESSLEGAGLTGWVRLRGEDAKIRAAQQELETAKNDASRKVSGHLVNLQSLRAVHLSQEVTAQAAQSTLASFLRQYDAGRKTWIDVLNTQKELADNRLALEQTRISELELALRLSVITGALDALAQIQP
jgi:adhesin transport system outer membrane protein